MPNGDYLVIPEINPGYEWVFEDETVAAVEKLDGTNVSIIIENGNITSIFNRTERIPFINKGKKWISEGILNSFERGYMDLLPDGQIFGELIGPRVNGNPYKLKEHLWIPFNTYCREHLAYKSYHKYPKDFENIEKWFLADIKDGGIFSLLMRKRGIEQKPEGIVFHNIKTGQMAKLRIDMFHGFTGKKHREKYIEINNS